MRAAYRRFVRRTCERIEANPRRSFLFAWFTIAAALLVAAVQVALGEPSLLGHVERLLLFLSNAVLVVLCLNALTPPTEGKQ